MHRKFRPFISSVLLSLILLGTSGFSEKADLQILKKALEKNLGEKTNYGAPRIVTLERWNVRGEDKLFIAVFANKYFTSCGVRHGALEDTADILKIAKGWGWAEKINRIMILEKSEQARPLFSCSVSAETIAAVGWESISTKELLRHLENPQFYEVEK